MSAEEIEKRSEVPAMNQTSRSPETRRLSA